MSLRKTTLEIATAKLGVKEKGTNAGKDVEMFQRAAKLPAGTPWCAAFINWAAEEGAKKLGVLSPLEKIDLQGYVPAYVNHGIANGWNIPFEQTKPGDIFCLYNSALQRYAHIGFISSVDHGARTFETVEGNSNTEGSREGKECCSNHRHAKADMVYLRWTKTVELKPAVKKAGQK